MQCIYIAYQNETFNHHDDDDDDEGNDNDNDNNNALWIDSLFSFNSIKLHSGRRLFVSASFIIHLVVYHYCHNILLLHCSMSMSMCPTNGKKQTFIREIEKWNEKLQKLNRSDLSDIIIWQMSSFKSFLVMFFLALIAIEIRKKVYNRGYDFQLTYEIFFCNNILLICRWCLLERKTSNEWSQRNCNITIFFPCSCALDLLFERVIYDAK